MPILQSSKAIVGNKYLFQVSHYFQRFYVSGNLREIACFLENPGILREIPQCHREISKMPKYDMFCDIGFPAFRFVK